MLSLSKPDHFYRLLEKIDYGSLKVTDHKGVVREFCGSHEGVSADLTITDWRFFSSLLMRGDIGFATSYRDGFWSSNDLHGLLFLALKNSEALEKLIYGSWLWRVVSRVGYLFRINSLKGSRRNILSHYDLGNDFFALWLDESMTYSSALFARPDDDLATAQQNKNSRIIQRLARGNSRLSGRMLEIGCGWGGFATQVLAQEDIQYRGITLSPRQAQLATHRLRDFFHSHIAVEDYRKQQGIYDYLVSIEMFEAVGEKYWPTYFSALAKLLRRNGTAMVQTITIKENFFQRYRRGGDLIRSFIFPGGMLATQELFSSVAVKAGLKTTNCHSFGKDYSKTLRCWMANFTARSREIGKLGFDAPFQRLWMLYLASCSAAFLAERTDVMQFELMHV